MLECARRTSLRTPAPRHVGAPVETPVGRPAACIAEGQLEVPPTVLGAHLTPAVDLWESGVQTDAGGVVPLGRGLLCTQTPPVVPARGAGSPATGVERPRHAGAAVSLPVAVAPVQGALRALTFGDEVADAVRCRPRVVLRQEAGPATLQVATVPPAGDGPTRTPAPRQPAPRRPGSATDRTRGPCGEWTPYLHVGS